MEKLDFNTEKIRLLNSDELLNTNGGSPKVAIGWKLIAATGVFGAFVVVGALGAYAAYKIVKAINE